jgi:hypothetical protein
MVFPTLGVISKPASIESIWGTIAATRDLNLSDTSSWYLSLFSSIHNELLLYPSSLRNRRVSSEKP